MLQEKLFLQKENDFLESYAFFFRLENLCGKGL